MPQTLRITGHVARLLHSLDDGWDPYWRDIFIMPPAKTVHAAFVADNPGLWPLEFDGAGTAQRRVDGSVCGGVSPALQAALARSLFDSTNWAQTLKPYSISIFRGWIDR